MGEVLIYTAPERLHEIHLDEKNVFVNVEPHSAKDEEKKQTDQHERDCAICLDALWETDGSTQQQQRVVALKGCSHEFHYHCIQSSLTNSSTKCPLCSKPIQHDENNQTAKGRCPSGTMTTSVVLNMTCQGFAPGTIQIPYNIPSGIQKSYHPHPGVPFSGASRVAYLPNNHLGQELLVRMQYAFCHGLSFMVGTSLTTAQPNVVTWASIHHKTCLSGGTQSFGFPDESYFTRCNGELDGLGVPDAAACQQWLQNLPA
jgi:deltex-like protein